MSNKHYWINKEERAKKAKNHTIEMEEKFGKEIEECVKNTRTYSFFMTDKEGMIPEEIIVEDIDVLSAIKKYSSETERVMVLNFASYKNPGGMFLNGSSAQEEALCHGSFLYNVLSKMPEYYEWNNKYKNRGFYQNRALYTSDVLFGDNKIDVLTCAAPNRSAAERCYNFTEKENYETLESRISFIMNIVKEEECDTLILGAWGCGVFKQDPKLVAELFKKHLTGKKVIFAVPAGTNLDAFEEVFEC